MLQILNEQHDNLFPGKPYRLIDKELTLPDYLGRKFRQACTWSSFTIDRNDVAWTYKTFICEFS